MTAITQHCWRLAYLGPALSGELTGADLMPTFQPEVTKAKVQFFSTGNEDERLKVEDSRVTPLNAVCRLVGPENIIATGVALSPHVVLTAGHVLVTAGAGSVWVADPAYNSGRIYPPIRAIHEVAHPGWQSSHSGFFDIGLLVLETAVQAGIVPSKWQPFMAELPIYVVGYDQQRPEPQYYDTGRFTGASSSLVAHDCDTNDGQSGAPVFSYGSHGTQLVATHVGGYNDYRDLIPGNTNKCVRFTPEIYEWIRSTVQEIEQ